MGMKKLNKKALISLGLIGVIALLSLKAYAKQNQTEEQKNKNYEILNATTIKDDTDINSVKIANSDKPKTETSESKQNTDSISKNNTETNINEEDSNIHESIIKEILKNNTSKQTQKAEKMEKIEKKEKRTNLNNFLFIGDSYTYLLKDTIKANNDNVFIEAKSGSRPSYWLDRVDSMPDNNSVEGVVLLIGVNGASTDENKKDVVTLMNKLSEKYPNKKIYVQKIFHVGRDFHAKGFNDKIDVLNEIIENHVNTLENFTFIDTTTGLLDEDGYLKYTYDELHIDSSKNEVFYNNILTAIQECESN